MFASIRLSKWLFFIVFGFSAFVAMAPGAQAQGLKQFFDPNELGREAKELSQELHKAPCRDPALEKRAEDFLYKVARIGTYVEDREHDIGHSLDPNAQDTASDLLIIRSVVQSISQAILSDLEILKLRGPCHENPKPQVPPPGHAGGGKPVPPPAAKCAACAGLAKKLAELDAHIALIDAKIGTLQRSNASLGKANTADPNIQRAIKEDQQKIANLQAQESKLRAERAQIAAQKAECEKTCGESGYLFPPIPGAGGFYVGLNTGVSVPSSSVGWNPRFTPPDNVLVGQQAAATFNKPAFMIGAQVGYDVANGPWVFGGVADINFNTADETRTTIYKSPFGGSFPMIQSFSSQVETTERVRVGYNIATLNGLVIMPFVTGGFAAAQIKTSDAMYFPTSFNRGDSSTLRPGWTIGAGVGLKSPVLPFRLQAQYLHEDFGSNNYAALNTMAPGSPIDTRHRFTEDRFTLGVNFPLGDDHPYDRPNSGFTQDAGGGTGGGTPPATPTTTDKKWSKTDKLTWTDYTGIREEGDQPDNDSYTATYVSYDGCKCDHGKIICARLSAYMDPKHSFVDPNGKTDLLLDHEQGHFNLTEISARKLKKKLSETICKEGENVDKVVEGLGKEASEALTKAENDYDEKTNHGTDQQKQNAADKDIEKQLNQLDAFK